MQGFELLKLTVEMVEFGVGDLRIVVDVILFFVIEDLAAKVLKPSFGPVRRARGGHPFPPVSEICYPFPERRGRGPE
jgi:hypothetical protein